MRTGYAAMAVVGVAAAVACFALTQSPVLSGMSLKSTDHAFNKYLAKYGKSYTNKEEYEYRKALFDAQMTVITEHNAQNDKTWFQALNKFSDMTAQEVKNSLGGGIAGEHREHLEVIPELSQRYGAVDWRSKMQPVRDQGQCGSCWAFASIATLEGRYAIKKGSGVALSEQQLVDCAKTSYGCGGGWASKAFQYIQASGSQSRASYAYTGRDGTCRYNAGSVAARVSGVSGVGDAKSAVNAGPVAVYVQAQSGFMSYGGGIFNGACGQYDHAVTVVGWGQSGATEYWIIRNSWGSGWGEAGHIRVQINGNCRITFDSYPIVA